ncbi:hypothetical protein [Dysgonomonas sp. BGC7]|uniref:hypothetical protein n=1 Tax=Dysgonomonas sp. BGC7 TaxID=1658008 RepID=UPI00067FA7F5|nr:hypothetical protein [Dysgonomonas sp. BGC7]MBD8387197.1 hypothetical protein [Dysgonomonas sp. BGC7]
MVEFNRNLTSEDVLNIFVEQHRLASPFDPEADPFIELSFDSSIAEWRDANDLISWRPLSLFLNKEFRISPSEKEWKSVLTPSCRRTLKGVCDLIVTHSSNDNIYPMRVLGKECLSSSVFFTLKRSLKEEGVDVSEIRPSTALSPYLDKYFSEMIMLITILAKGYVVFDQFDIIEITRGDKPKKGLAHLFSFFSKTPLFFETGDIKTFRDLTLKLIEVNSN